MSGPELQAYIVAPPEIAIQTDQTPTEMLLSGYEPLEKLPTNVAVYEVETDDQESSIGFIGRSLTRAREILANPRPSIISGRRLAAGVAVVLSALATAKSQELVSPDTAAAKVKTNKSIRFDTSSIKPQTIINKIHEVLQPIAGDGVQNNNCNLGGTGKPNVPCRSDKITPTTAFLSPSSGGFTTDCKSPYISTYRYYRINTSGQSYRTCGPLGVWPEKSKKNQFTTSLSNIGDTIQKSIELPANQSTRSIVANRRTVTTSYECQVTGNERTDPSNLGDSTSLVKKIVLKYPSKSGGRKNAKYSKASIYSC